jgi:putative ABC transport system permease protein
MFGRLVAVVRGLLTRHRAERELDEELRFHIEMETQANIETGMAPLEAKRVALRDLGGVDQTKEQVRDERASVLDSLALDVGYAVRRMKRDPRSATVVAVTMALAVGLATTVYSIATSVLLRPLPYHNPAELALVFRTVGDVNIIPLPIPEFLDLRARSKTISAMAGLQRDGYAVVAPGVTEWADAFSVTANLFTILGVEPLVGRTFLPHEDQSGHERVVVLAEAFWRRVFAGNPAIVGQYVRLAGPNRRDADADTYEVIGVVPASVRLFYRLPLEADIYLPRVLQPGDRAEEARMSPGFFTFVRLAPGVSVEQADREVRMVLKAVVAEHPAVSVPRAGSRVTSLHEELVGQTRPAFLLLAAAALILLVIGCVNIASVLLADANRRTPELMVRLAIGCSRRRLWQQLLTEHVLLALAGGGLGALVTVWAIPVLRWLAPASLPRVDQIAAEPRAFLFALGMSVLAGLASGAAPAWLMSRPAIGNHLRSGAGTLAPRTRRVRAGFVIVTTALALTLLTCAGVIANGLWRLAHLDLGFAPSQVTVFTIDLPERWQSNARSVVFERELLARVRGLPGVGLASASSELPFAWGALDPNVILPGGHKAPPSEVTAADPDYIRLLKVPLRAGRLLDTRDDGSRRVALINEAFQRSFGQVPALGQRILVAKEPREVVGIVGNITEVGQIQGGVIRRAGFNRLTTPAVYIPSGTYHEQFSFRVLLVRTSLPLPTLTRAVNGQLHAIDPEVTVRRAGSLEERVHSVGGDARFFATIIGTFALVALILASVGLYGLLAQSVSHRSREIGIRVALGADSRRIGWLVVGEAMALVAIGSVVGVVLVLAGGKATRSLLFEVGPADPLTLLGVVAVLAVVAGVATALPTRRAVRVDVVSVLKTE